MSDLLTMCADCFVEWSRTAGVRPFGGGRREDPLCGYSHATPGASALEHIRRCNSKVILAPEVDVDQEGWTSRGRRFGSRASNSETSVFDSRATITDE